jgi:hypothetical protein
LDVSKNTALTTLNIGQNDFTSLDVSKITALTTLNIRENGLTSLDVSNNTVLEYLNCNDNRLSRLDLSSNIALAELWAENNPLTNLDVTKCISLEKLDCSGTKLINLDISNNTALIWLAFDSTPTLNEVCVWTMPFPPEGVDVASWGCPNMYYSKDCSTTQLEEHSYCRLSLFPNPINNLFTIETSSIDHYSIEITSLNGQLLLNKQVEGTTHQLDLSSFDSGVYFITIRSNDFVTKRKIIKL